MKPLRLKPRHYALFAHLRLYLMSTPEIIHTFFFRDLDLSAKAVLSFLERGRSRGLFTQYPLGTKHYVRLGLRATHLLGLSPKMARPLGPQALARALAFLLVCHARPNRRKLSLAELRGACPELLRPDLDTNYFLEKDEGTGTTRLALLRLDQGATSVERKLYACRCDIERRLQVPAWEEIIRSRFFLAVVTGSPHKAEKFREFVQKHPWPLPVVVESYPELAPLTSGVRLDT